MAPQTYNSLRLYIKKKAPHSIRSCQQHLAGDKLFIDYCGPTVPIVNPETGEIRTVQIFVATLGASNYTYVEASKSQRLESWLQAHVNAFEFFGGVPHLLVPDNLRAAVMLARPYKPKDKAKAENAV
jgi:transposase